MGCKAARLKSGEGRYQCSVSGDSCVYLIPDSKRCAEQYGEGPDAFPDEKCELCASFYTEDNKRCCQKEPLAAVYEKDGSMSGFAKSKYIEPDVLSCGAFSACASIPAS